MSPVISKRCTNHVLFKEQDIDVDITGLNHQDIFQHPAEIIDSIVMLHKQLNSGHNAQKQIDQYCLPLLWHHQHQKPASDKTWKLFMPKLAHVFSKEHLYDIGNNVRSLSAQVQSHGNNNVFARLIQYSLPYVKHNRLTFPKFEDVNAEMLMHMIQIILACCIGMHENDCKKPVWQLRFRILMYMYTLLVHGSVNDLYEFCAKNLNLFRIAIIEYFVLHVQEHMPCEYETMHYLFGSKTNIPFIFAQFRQNINLFRSMHMQTTDLNWSTLNSKAHTIIEKCNRICKGKPRVVPKSIEAHAWQPISKEEILQALNYDQWGTHKLKLSATLMLNDIRSQVRYSVLPQNVVQAQISALRKAMMRDSVKYASSFYMHVCVQCLQNKGNRSKQMLRTNSKQQAFCHICKDSSYILCLNALGRLLHCMDDVFYYCPFCLQVHLWHSTGTEFSQCALLNDSNIHSKSKNCLICSRTNSLHAVSALDSALGVMQHMHLCSRHVPFTHQLPFVHDLHALAEAMTVKNKNHRYI